jgi:hypothetical protein
MAIEIKFLANLVSFIRGTRDMSTHLDQVGESIADVVEEAEQAERAGEDIGDGVAKGARDADTSLDRLRRGFQQVQDESRRTSRDARQDFDRMADNTQEFKNEAVQNLSEVASSFKGDLSDMADGVQGLTGGLASALTPGIGIPVAILGAAAAVFGANWANATEESKERVAGMFQAFLDAGSEYLQADQWNQAITDLAADQDKWNQALKVSEGTGLSVQTILRAMAGDQSALASAIDSETSSHRDRLTTIQNSALSMEDQAAAVLLENQRHQESIGLLKQVQTDTDTAAAKAAAVSAAFGTANTQLDSQVRKIQDLASRLGGLSSKGVTIPIRADTTGLDGILARYQGRTIQMNVHGQITKIGQNVW